MPAPRRIALLVLALAALDAAAAPPQVASDVAGFRIAAAGALPAPAHRMTFEDGSFCCNGLADPPRTAAGRQAATLGWYVTSEVERAGYTAIGIFSRGSEGTSGTCFIADGNIVLYRDAQPVAIVYGKPGTGDEGGMIGGVLATSAPDRLRISDWTPVGFENADITLAPDRIAVVAIAASETFCGGLTVPNLRGKTIPDVRTALAPLGWKPAVFGKAPDEDNPEDAAHGYRKQGLTEFEDCSGTGYGFCSVRYTHPKGATLDVTTVGDEPPTVSGYDVTCGEPKP